MNPWEKYASTEQSNTQSAPGPWSKYEYSVTEDDRLSDSPPPEETKGPPPSWGEVIGSVPQSVVRDLAGIAVGAASQGHRLSGKTIDPNQMLPPDPTPENMTSAQSATQKGLKFAAESAIPIGGGPVGPLIKAGANAGLGFASGFLGDVVGRDTHSPIAELATNLAVPLGVVAGVKAAPHVGKGAGAIAGNVNSIVRGVFSKSPETVNLLAEKTFGKLLHDLDADELKQLAVILQTGTETFPGMGVTVGQSVAEGAMTPGSNQLGRNLLKFETEVSPLISTLPVMKDQQTNSLIAQLEQQAGGSTREAREAAIRQILDQRAAKSGPLLQAATTRANIAGELLPQYQDDIAKLVDSKVNALQQEGQLRTGAAQAINSTNPRPPLGPMEQRVAERGGQPFENVPGQAGQYPPETLVPNPLQTDRAGFYPVQGQPRLPGRLSPQNDRAAEMTAAADDFASHAKEMGEFAGQIDNEIQRMALNGLAPLEAQPLLDASRRVASQPKNLPDEDIQSILTGFNKRIADATNERGVVDAESLGKIRAKLNEDIQNLVANKPGWSDREASGIITGLKNNIDEAITQAGGREWTQGLATYGKYSREAQKKLAQQALLRNLRNESGDLRPEAFLDITGEGEAKFLRSIGADPNTTKLKNLIGDDNYKVVERVRGHIAREMKKADMVENTRIPDESRTTAARLPNFLNRELTILNSIMAAAFKKSTLPTQKRMGEMLADSKGFSEYVTRMASTRINSEKFNIPFDLRQQSLPGLMQYPANQLSATLETE